MLQPIGQGGMGEVWLAEQKQSVRRRVAIKLIKAGMDTREVVARFESERQALALMHHPAIAKVRQPVVNRQNIRRALPLFCFDSTPSGSAGPQKRRDSAKCKSNRSSTRATAYIRPIQNSVPGTPDIDRQVS